MAKKTTKKMGRPKLENPCSERVYIALTVEEKRRLASLAAAWKVKVQDMTRWWIDEAISGQWTPAHMRNLSAQVPA